MGLSVQEMCHQDDQVELLLEAIDSASRRTLQSVLKTVCLSDQPTRDRVSKSLLITEDQVRPASPSSEEDDDEESMNSDDEQSEDEKPPLKERHSNQQTPGSKRLRPRYAYCENCEQEFDVTQNTSTSCKYHTDSCYPNGDCFVNDDCYYDGGYDNGEMLEEFPERYIYECCDRRGHEEGCTAERHSERVSLKRQKVK
ncbi:hypothetical protein ABOM_003834 [Aspergillus bombycis]|uniref:Uncharacterized protein n=1 Tax=Aspergillus bombycis TaxID=109264 RepID=A0A1F8A6H4_9EURO|nr:hypothetical protein ABOM_003834 [Aspergillus bombycis]OGM47326.1 hypothetical protein ABOM_003834 [Aspergillus bombycis]